MKKKRLVKALTFLVTSILILVLMSFVLPQKQKKGAPWKVPEKYKKMKNPSKNDKSLLRVGKMLYAKHCKSCHGSRGLGDGPKAKQQKTFPGNFSTKAFKAQSDGVIYYQSIIGRDDMPNFEKKIPDKEDQWAVINYILTKF